MAAKHLDIEKDSLYLGLKAQLNEQKKEYLGAMECYIKLVRGLL